jgi:tetraacyldisaccharide 4'-kinase
MIAKKNILLYPFSLIYGFITGFRNFLYNTGVLSSKEFEVPLICVGNISVGGTGKTPHTEYLAELLKEHFKVATLSRGYKRRTRDFQIASDTSLVSEIGDEPLQISRKFPEVMVAVDRNRVNGVKKILVNNPGTNVIIMDDAFQHRRITPGLSILLSDYNRLFFNDHMLPYGSLRESKRNIRRADIILITKSPENISPIERRIIVKEIDKAAYQNLFFTSLTYQSPIPVFVNEQNKDSQPDVSVFSESGVLLVTGIANPDSLYKHLKDITGELIHLSFPDHYRYKKKDLESISDAFGKLKSPSKYIITTEKDAVRLREFTNIAESLKAVFYYIPVGITFLNDDKDAFDNMIINYVRKNKRNNKVSEIQRND